MQAAEMRRALARPTEDMGSYDLTLRALSLFRNTTKTNVLTAVQLLDRAVALDPGYGYALALAATCHGLVLIYGWSDDPPGHLLQSTSLRQRALAVAADDANVLANAAIAAFITGGEADEILAIAERATALNPGSSICWLVLGWAHIMGGAPAVGIEQFRTSLRLDPLSPDENVILTGLGVGHFMQGRFSEAMPFFKRAALLRPEALLTHVFMAAAYAHLGELGAARDTLARFRAASSVALSEWVHRYRNPLTRKLLLDGIALAEADQREA